MFSHLVIGSNDLEKTKKFYDATMKVIGAPEGAPAPKGRLIYAHNGGRLLITQPVDGQPATPANGGTIGFAMTSPEQVEAWHKAGVESGGTTCEDPPGLRDGPNGKIYLAYLRDPDGNKLCAAHRVAS
jgi:catechol 2,3-dioxygenase-like lactoylglutathione lyase family enzyme